MFSAKHRNNSETGFIGETIACRYLSDEKYKILYRNYREKFDEIDIIARSFNGYLVFCEVKTLNIAANSKQGIIPEDNLTKNKLAKITRICELFSAKHPELVDSEKGWRIDLIAISLRNGKAANINHYENIGYNSS